jgi:hypothetical protein
VPPDDFNPRQLEFDPADLEGLTIRLIKPRR